MAKATSATLPDLDDDEFAAKLRPLENAVLPNTGRTSNRIYDHTDNRIDSKPTKRKSRLSVAERIEEIEQIRGPKRRFEYLIPVRVGDALAEDASKRGQSAATRLLEVLRDAGYPVKPEDFVDLRKERAR
jgi:hypothetical protein